MEKLVVQGVIELIGPIRQELLSGIKERAKYELVRERLRVFPDLARRSEYCDLWRRVCTGNATPVVQAIPEACFRSRLPHVGRYYGVRKR
jgi:hypothetical protein